MSFLSVENLSKKFKEVTAVDGISFSLEKGEILGLLGPNGAGKSTTISMISTLLRPDTGEIMYENTSILKKPKRIQAQLGYVPQEIALYPTLSGRENLEFWGRAYGLKGSHLKNRVNTISEIIGIKERLKDKVKNYSGGMKRRLNIGAALLHEPELIIMDEPTVGIDPQSRKHILDTVLELNKQGMTVIYTSHYMEEVEYLCNKICIMDKGLIIANGTKDELVQMLNDRKKINIKVDQVNDKVINTIRNLKNVDNVLHEDTTIKVTMKNYKQNTFKELIDRLSEAQITIHSVAVNEPNLEAVFLHLTGRELRD